MKKWLTWGSSTYSEEDLRTLGWNDEMLKEPYSHGAVITDRHGVVVTNCRVSSVNKPEVSVANFKPTHFHNGPYGGDCTVKNINNKLCITTFSDGRSVYASTTQVEPITTKRDELIDDIEALCLSIEKRQSELSRLVKELKC